LTHNHGSQKTKEPIQEPTLNRFFVADSFMKPARFFEKFLKKKILEPGVIYIFESLERTKGLFIWMFF
jgi:hypothetical protein